MSFGVTSSTDTYLNASGSVAFDSEGLEVLKVKPPGVSREGKHGHGLGNVRPVVQLLGPINPSNPTMTVRESVWSRVQARYPDVITRLWAINVSYSKPDGETVSIDAASASLLKAERSEADASAAGEALVDLEFITTAVYVNGVLQ